MSRSLRIGGALVGLALALPFALWASFLAWDHTPHGLRLDGRPLSPTRDPSAELERRAQAWGAVPLHVDAEGTARARPRGELGASPDVASARRSVLRLARTGDPLRDLPALFSAWSGEADIDWRIRVDRATVAAFVEELANEVDRPPRPAEIDGRGRLVELSADGARLDRRGAIDAIAVALRSGRRSVRVPVTRLSSGLGETALAPTVRPSAPTVLLGRYSTRFATHGDDRPRAHNVLTAASYLDGAVIPAHERLSFNDRVGERSTDRGYRIAHVIADGEMVDGLGGGVCQVASTLHAAAFLAGLTVVDHTPHSRPSAYIPMGLDATVVWPNVDLVLRNPYPSPILVRARADGGRMVVELFGRDHPPRVDWSRRVIETEDFADRYVEDPTVPPGEERESQAGIRGFLLERERVIEDGLGPRRQETRLRYPPTDRIVRVSPGTLDPATGLPRDRDAPPPNPY